MLTLTLVAAAVLPVMFRNCQSSSDLVMFPGRRVGPGNQDELSDGALNISGGRSMRDKFVTNNGCSRQDPPEPKAGSLTHTCTMHQGCTSGHPVEWCAFDGGHTPGIVDGGGDDGART